MLGLKFDHKVGQEVIRKRNEFTMYLYDIDRTLPKTKIEDKYYDGAVKFAEQNFMYSTVAAF